MFSFDCAGGRDGGQDLIRGLTLWSHLANVGDAKSLIIHPASTTHRQLSDDELRAAGVGPGTVRLSVGTESVEDLIWDLEQGFALVAATRPRARKGRRLMSDFDLARYQDPLTIQRVLHTAKTIAIVGLSANELRASNFVGYYLRRHGYRVIPVNPRETEILGREVLPEPAGRARAGGHRERLPRAGRAAARSRGTRWRSAPAPCGASSA